ARLFDGSGDGRLLIIGANVGRTFDKGLALGVEHLALQDGEAALQLGILEIANDGLLLRGQGPGDARKEKAALFSFSGGGEDVWLDADFMNDFFARSIIFGGSQAQADAVA